MKMKIALTKLISLLLLTLAAFALGLANPAIAGRTANGAKIFSENCASCHMGGGNIIIAHKTLKQPALKKYNMDSIEAIVNQLLNGKNAMPSFRGRLDAQQIEDVAAYVLEQAETGWRAQYLSDT